MASISIEVTDLDEAEQEARREKARNGGSD